MNPDLCELELLPCPFCNLTNKLSLQLFPGCRHNKQVYCDSCGAWGPARAEAWNKRQNPDQIALEVKAFLQVLDNGLEIQPGSALHKLMRKAYDELEKP